MKRKFVDFKVLTASLCCAVVMGVISFAFLKNARIIVRIQGVFPYCIWLCHFRVYLPLLYIRNTAVSPQKATIL